MEGNVRAQLPVTNIPAVDDTWHGIDIGNLTCPTSESEELKQCTHMELCSVDDPCCMGPFCCEKKFWPKRCQEEEKGQMEGKALPKPCWPWPC